MREPIATAPATGAATMFGISNVQLVQHSFNGGLPPLKADSPMPGGILRPVSRASSVGGTTGGGVGVTGGTLGSMKSSSGASSPAASVKRNSSSSSFGSSSDRRSVFYTDPIPDSDQSSRTTEATGGKYDAMTNDDSCSASDAGNNVVAMASNGSGDGDVVTKHQQQRKHAKQQQQRQGLRDESLRRLVDGQVRRKQRPCSAAILEGVIGPKAHLKLVSQELEWERKFRDDQLSRILKALIAFETRLKNEQTRIKQQLYEKDDVINRQNCTINRMKRKLAADEAAGSDDGEETTIDEVAQYCPKCRKNYYRLECRTNGTQTFEYCLEDGAESVNTENLSLNSVEYASSSEEQESSLYVRANSFKDARRSRKYTSKRSYQGYQQRGTASRASSFTSNASGPTTGRTLAKLTERNEGRDAIRLQRGGTAAAAAAADDDGTESGHEAYVNIEPNANVPKIVIYENYESDKENKRLDQNQRRRECNNYDNVEPYSNRIDTLHGIHAGRFGKQHADGRNDYHLASPSKRGSVAGSEEQMELDDGTIFYEANTTGGGGNNQAKYTEGMEMKQTIETNDDWYASASDMEDSDTALGKPYSNAAVNPVLECVNQILLQQSMDGFGDSNKDTTTNGDGNAVEEEDELYIKAQELPQHQQQQQQPPPPAKEPSTTVRSKRVHFSTQNSMVQVPRITTGPTLGGGNRKDDKLSPTYEIQSISRSRSSDPSFDSMST